jgi:hypothetical protein
MRRLKIDNRLEAYKIEAIRYTYVFATNANENLKTALNKMDSSEINEPDVITALSSCWQIIDNSFRFLRLLQQVKGIRKKEIWMASVAKLDPSVEKFRNYIQHINSHVPRIQPEIYPILGVISWPSKNNQQSNSASMGGNPTGTMINTLSFDTSIGEYLPGIIFNADVFKIDISNLMKSLQLIRDGFDNWLSENSLFGDGENRASFTKMGSLKKISENRYVRLKVSFDRTVDPESGEILTKF